MEFTYKGYQELIECLTRNGYIISNYLNYNKYDKTVILRHDIDYSVEKALEFAKIENKLGVKSTYFVLISSPFYNAISQDVTSKIKNISVLGHDIGLHFDELNYDKSFYEDNGGINEIVESEARILESILDIEINTVSMHRPSKQTLDSNYTFDNLINSYGQEFFNNFKYLSDSRMRWREDVKEIIESNQYNRLHILTHAFWYSQSNKDIKSILKSFIEKGNGDRYSFLENNITDLNSIVRRNEIK